MREDKTALKAMLEIANGEIHQLRKIKAVPDRFKSMTEAAVQTESSLVRLLFQISALSSRKGSSSIQFSFICLS
jgi:hypothetical protein